MDAINFAGWRYAYPAYKNSKRLMRVVFFALFFASPLTLT